MMKKLKWKILGWMKYLFLTLNSSLDFGATRQRHQHEWYSLNTLCMLEFFSMSLWIIKSNEMEKTMKKKYQS